MSEPLPIGRRTPAALTAERARLLRDRLRQGDETALESIIDLYWDRLLRYAFRLLQSADAAEDVAQEAFVRLWHGRKGSAGMISVQAFLYATTRNLCLNERRRRDVRERFSVRKMIPVATAPPSPLEDAEAAECDAAVRAAVDALPARRREIFELARQDGLSYREIADVLQLSPQTVANQMSAALKQLREVLARYLEDG